MLQVIAGGVIALVSGWILDGGLRRRNRRTIREEFELAELLKGRPGSADLYTSADRRLERYVTPFWTRLSRLRVRARVVVVFVATLTLLGMAVALWLARHSIDQHAKDNLLNGLVVGVTFGTLAVATYQFLDRGLITIVEDGARLMIEVGRVYMRVAKDIVAGFTSAVEGILFVERELLRTLGGVVARVLTGKRREPPKDDDKLGEG